MLPRFPSSTARKNHSQDTEELCEIQGKISHLLTDRETFHDSKTQIQTLVQTGHGFLNMFTQETDYDYQEENYARKLLAPFSVLRTRIGEIIHTHQDLKLWYDEILKLMGNDITKIHLMKRLEDEILFDYAYISIDEQKIPIRDFYHLFGNYENETKALTGHKRIFGGVDGIQRIQFMDNFFDAKNVSELTGILQEFQDVKMVSFYKSGLHSIDNKGVCALAELISSNNVKSLAFLNTDLETILEDKYSPFWGSCQNVRALFLSFNSLSTISSEDLQHWGNFFPNLRLLHLGINPLDGLIDESLQALFSFSHLKSLSLYDLNLGGYDIQTLQNIFSKLGGLSSLDLGNNFDAALSIDKINAIFPHLKRLKSLGFSANVITSYSPEKLRVIFEHLQLQALEMNFISFQKFNQQQLSTIFHAPHLLHSLALEGCEINQVSLNHLEELFASFTSLKKLNLNNNSLGECSYEYFQAIFTPLHDMQEIGLIGNDFYVFEKEIWDLILGTLIPGGRVILQSHEREQPKILTQLTQHYPHVRFEMEDASLTDFQY